MSEDEFLTHKKALISHNLQKDQNLGQASRRMWEQIASEQYEFDARMRQVAEIKTVTKKDVLVGQVQFASREFYLWNCLVHLIPGLFSRFC